MSAPHHACLKVIAPGIQTTLQDLGRPGHQAIGISPSGAMDPFALRQANALLGNAQNAPALEVSLLGPTLRAEGVDIALSLLGDFAPLIDGEPIPSNRSFILEQGQELAVGALRSGRYGYIGFAGRLALEPTLGSYATHLGTGIGGLGGRALQAGDCLDLKELSNGAARLKLASTSKVADDPIRFLPGPQDDHFSGAQLSAFQASDYAVASLSDRQGYRMEGPALTHLPDKGADITSDGIALGSIQVPANGAPIVLMADRHTMGGYAKIGTVIGADLPRLAQKRPGETVRFKATTPHEAVAARRAAEQSLARLISSLQPAKASGELTSEQLLSMNLISGVVGASS